MSSFPFDELPTEMKEMVLEKIDPEDSLKLLQVNRQLRNYTLFYGPWNNKVLDNLQINFWMSGNSMICWFNRSILSDYPLSDTSDEVLNRLVTRIRSTRLIRLNQVDHYCWLSFKLPLPEIFTQFPMVNRYELSISQDFAIRHIFEMYQPQVLEEFVFINRRFVPYSSAEVDTLIPLLRVMLADCQSFQLYGRGTEFLLELLPELNARKILFDDNLFTIEPEDRFLAWIEKTLVNGIPSRNPDAEICYSRSREPDFDFSRLWDFLSVRNSIKEVRFTRIVQDFKHFLASEIYADGPISTYVSYSPKKLAFALHDLGIDGEYMRFYARNL